MTFAGKPLSLDDLLPRPHLSPTPELKKYWSQRYRLFSRYDDGVCLDKGMTSCLDKGMTSCLDKDMTSCQLLHKSWPAVNS